MRVDLFLFREVERIKEQYKKLIVYPFGQNGRLIKKYLSDWDGEVVYVDHLNNNGKDILDIDIFGKTEYKDYQVLVCAGDVCIYQEIRNNLYKYIPKDSGRIIDLYDKPILEGCKVDIIRMASLEAAMCEILMNHVPGNLAEAGVFEGDFSRLINYYLPHKKMYLIDTFEGFDARDLDKEKEFTDSRVGHYRCDDVQRVLDSMLFKEQCVIKKGYVPDILEEIDDTFAFVSLDMDLYKPIYSGLKWFYPRLEKGGYIFVHDCRNTAYWGARQALLDFCKETGASYYIIPDACGTAVITK